MKSIVFFFILRVQAINKFLYNSICLDSYTFID